MPWNYMSTAGTSVPYSITMTTQVNTSDWKFYDVKVVDDYFLPTDAKPDAVPEEQPPLEF